MVPSHPFFHLTLWWKYLTTWSREKNRLSLLKFYFIFRRKILACTRCGVWTKNSKEGEIAGHKDKKLLKIVGESCSIALLGPFLIHNHGQCRKEDCYRKHSCEPRRNYHSLCSLHSWIKFQAWNSCKEKASCSFHEGLEYFIAKCIAKFGRARIQFHKLGKVMSPGERGEQPAANLIFLFRRRSGGGEIRLGQNS